MKGGAKPKGSRDKPPVEIEDAVESIERSRAKSDRLSRTRNKDYSPLTFYMPEELDSAYEESDWSVQRRIKILTAIANNYKADPKAALSAIDLMEKYQWAAVKASGQIQEVATTTKSERDGVITEEDVKAMRLGGVVDANAKVIDIQEEEDEQGRIEEQEAEDDATPRDAGHKPPTDAFSGGLFSD